MTTPKTPPNYDMSLADHGMDSQEFRGLTYPLGEHAPEYGEYYPLLPGIGWTRLPVPGSLNHINIWLLDDRDAQGEGVAIVDTGLAFNPSKTAWETLFANGLAGRRVTRVIVTHFHPDHVGLAGWLCAKFGVKLWMNRTEWLMARMLTSDIRETPPQEALDQMRFAGWDDERIEDLRLRGWGNFAKAVSPVPVSHSRLVDGATLRVGARNWRIMTAGGHTPEHVSLIDEDNKVMIAGDQILPRITSNVSIMTSEPDADPLREWLTGLTKFRAALDAQTLVLPAHGFPFTGVHTRLDQLIDGHHERLDALQTALAKDEMRIVDMFGLLFARPVDDQVYGIATGEALAHAQYLLQHGRASCEIRNGVGWYRA